MAGQFRPPAVFQLQRDPKHPTGSRLGGVNCNPTAGATLVAFVTCGAKRTTGAAIRELTNDTEGGTVLSTVVAALRRGFGVDIDVDTGSFERIIKALDSRRGVTLSGSSIATRGTRFQASETFDGNHQWALTDIRTGDGGRREILVFDPLADGRRRGIAISPMWIPAAIVREFAGKLDLRSKAEKAAKRPRRPLGMGRATYGLTEIVACGGKAVPVPRVRLRAGASLVHGQAGRDRVVGVAIARIRERPTTTSDIVGRKRAGDTFRAFQRIKGQRVAGAPIWLGDRTGERWMHASLFRALSQVAEPGVGQVGDDPEAVAIPDAADDQGTDDELLEGAEDGVDEEVVDEVAAESSETLDTAPRPGA
ncbi:MAG TPA: hypothetical protein VFP66_14325 [Candidatus Limnocylindrales bacterium]|nr:hypothetical protein [Candidatus Limnocylindrales bacterium]